MTLQNIPFICLLLIALGVVFIVGAIFLLAKEAGAEGYYTTLTSEDKESKEEIQDLFHYFLEEEEKKNQNLREMFISQQEGEESKGQTIKQTNEAIHDKAISEMISLSERGLSSDEIAKQLKKGVGEVKLILSLYAMK